MASRQIPFDLTPVQAPTFDNFLSSECNAAVVSRLVNWQNWPAPVLLLIGESGVGKSHLGQAWAGLRSEDLRFIDDADTVDEGVLFTAINGALTGEVKALVLAACSHPKTWNIALPDLRSRLLNTPVLEISAPDDELLSRIVRALFDAHGRVVSQDLVGYIVSRTERSVPALQALVARLETQAQADKADMTKAYVARHINSGMMNGELEL